MTTTTLGSKSEQRSTLPAAASKRNAIVIWAAIGVLYLLIELYSYGHWILSGNATPTSTGITPVPGSMQHWALFWQWSLGAGALALFYVFVVKPWRRDGRISVYGVLWIAAQTMWFQDAFLNYFVPVFSYNSILINWGSWNASVPGWQSFNAEKMPSPVVLYLGMYPIVFCGAPIFLASLMKKAKARWPGLGNLALIATMYVALGLFAVAAEGAWIRTGMYTYTGLWSPLTLWPEETYKVPVLYIFLVDSLVFTSLACMIYFRDDKGYTFAEKGAGSGNRTVMRLLAMIGATNAILFTGYSIPVNFFALQGAGWSPSVLEKSYFTNGVCGDGTDYACPGGSIPVPLGRNTIHMGPDGTLVIPRGSELPRRVVHARN